MRLLLLLLLLPFPLPLLMLMVMFVRGCVVGVNYGSGLLLGPGVGYYDGDLSRSGSSFVFPSSVECASACRARVDCNLWSFYPDTVIDNCYLKSVTGSNYKPPPFIASVTDIRFISGSHLQTYVNCTHNTTHNI